GLLQVVIDRRPLQPSEVLVGRQPVEFVGARPVGHRWCLLVRPAPRGGSHRCRQEEKVTLPANLEMLGDRGVDTPVGWSVKLSFLIRYRPATWLSGAALRVAGKARVHAARPWSGEPLRLD